MNKSISIDDEGYQIRESIHAIMIASLWIGIFVVLFAPSSGIFWLTFRSILGLINTFFVAIILIPHFPIFEKINKDMKKPLEQNKEPT